MWNTSIYIARGACEWAELLRIDESFISSASSYIIILYRARRRGALDSNSLLSPPGGTLLKGIQKLTNYTIHGSVARGVRLRHVSRARLSTPHTLDARRVSKDLCWKLTELKKSPPTSSPSLDLGTRSD